MAKKEVILSQADIQERLLLLAQQVTQDYAGKSLLLVAVLNGAVIVVADFMRYLWQLGFENVQLDTIKISSYGMNTVSSGQPIITKDVQFDISGKHVLVVEDIVDTGLTLHMLYEHLLAKQAASVEILTLLSKPETIRAANPPIKYVGFEIENIWVEGYGIDTAEGGRSNPQVVQVVT